MIIDILSPQYRRDPYPIFKYLRAEKIICRAQPFGYWLVANYLDVQMILKNPTVFSSAGIIDEPAINNPEFFLHSRGLVGCDQPDHTRLRRLVSKAFTPSSIRNLELKIQKICRALIKDLISNDTVNIVDDFSSPLPIMVIAELMGIDPEKKSEFKKWANLLITWQKRGKTSEVLVMAKQMFDYFNEVIYTRRENPKDDLISNLILACKNDRTITSSEVLAIVRLFLIAATETTTNLITNGILALCSHPQQMIQILHNQALMHNFIEETLRYDSPVLSLSRRVTDDIKIAGTKIKKNEIVLPLLASANHDETMFIDPEKFDLTRNTRGHFSFGTGIHYCLGSQLARLQARVAFEELFKTFKRFEINKDKSHDYLDSFFFRSARNLWLIVTGNTNFDITCHPTQAPSTDF